MKNVKDIELKSCYRWVFCIPIPVFKRGTGACDKEPQLHLRTTMTMTIGTDYSGQNRMLKSDKVIYMIFINNSPSQMLKSGEGREIETGRDRETMCEVKCLPRSR